MNLKEKLCEQLSEIFDNVVSDGDSDSSWLGVFIIGKDAEYNIEFTFDKRGNKILGLGLWKDKLVPEGNPKKIFSSKNE